MDNPQICDIITNHLRIVPKGIGGAMKRPWYLLAVLPGSRFDKKALSEVQTGFSSSLDRIPWDLIWDVLIVLLGLTFILLILRRWVWPGRRRLVSSEDTRVTDPKQVRDIIVKSVDMRTMYDVDIMSSRYQELYKGQVLGVTSEGDIDIEINSFVDPELTFNDEPARVVFRMSRLGEEEFYQFDTMTKSIGYTSLYGRREKVLRMAMPHLLEIGQKRRALRVEPTGAFRVKFWLMKAYLPSEEQPITNFHKLHEVEIIDLSAVGLRAKLTARTADLRIRSGNDTYFRLDLPTGGLDLVDFPKSIYLKAKIVSVLRRQTGRRVMSRLADEQSSGPHDVRMDFVARGSFNPDKQTLTFKQTGELAFEGHRQMDSGIPALPDSVRKGHHRPAAPHGQHIQLDSYRGRTPVPEPTPGQEQ